MHQKKSKKIVIYFFLLILLSSINNLQLNNEKFGAIKKINITGLEKKDNQILLNKLKKINLENIFFINHIKLTEVLEKNSLVHNFNVKKKYPSSLDIEIKKTDFVAKISNSGKIMIVGSNGKFLKDEIYNGYLPFIFGKPSIQEILKFKKIIDSSKFSFDQIKNLYFFPSLRWDIDLNNNILLKLPVEQPGKALNFAYDILNNKNIKNIKILDVRIQNQIILND
tara:strand:- start:1750 stop:2421 length:672 start_codon:yes stop_codon:yes gene_type:complete